MLLLGGAGQRGLYDMGTARDVQTGDRMTQGRILFLDIDGTVRKSVEELGRYVNGPEDVEVYPEVPEILEAYRNAGWRIVGVTNQGGIALGYTTVEQVVAALSETQKQTGMRWDFIGVCRHHPDAKGGLETTSCWCRKPLVGLLWQAVDVLHEKHGEAYPPARSLMVGDMDSDRQCAFNATVPFMWADVWRRDGWKTYLEGEGG
jgi:D-glycero-D-manno-heptose 1,7-bisphosphate phosphatase